MVASRNDSAVQEAKFRKELEEKLNNREDATRLAEALAREEELKQEDLAYFQMLKVLHPHPLTLLGA